VPKLTIEIDVSVAHSSLDLMEAVVRAVAGFATSGGTRVMQPVVTVARPLFYEWTTRVMDLEAPSPVTFADSMCRRLPGLEIRGETEIQRLVFPRRE
jgi:hypothetical protein